MQNDTEHDNECRVNFAAGLIMGVRSGWHSTSDKHKVEMLMEVRRQITEVIDRLSECTPKPQAQPKPKDTK